MLKIGLISDTHGFVDPLVYEYFKDTDEIWHAGDFGSVNVAEELSKFKTLKGVYGNIDDQKIRSRFPEDLRMEVDGFKIFMTHIGGYPGKYNPRIRDILQDEQPDLFICGHSHILKVMKDPKFNNMLIMNPGAAGNIGLHKIKTVLRFTLANKQILDLEVVELGKRGARN